MENNPPLKPEPRKPVIIKKAPDQVVVQGEGGKEMKVVNPDKLAPDAVDVDLTHGDDQNKPPPSHPEE